MPPKQKVPKSKAKRRGNNEGSIFQRKDGRWCGMVTVGYKTDGKPIRKTIYATSRPEIANAVTMKTGEVFANALRQLCENRRKKVLRFKMSLSGESKTSHA